MPSGIGGLSPHMRGNLGVGVVADVVGRSIPAHAGEPSIGVWVMGAAQVYPRTCGGTC